jgi:hypothetical protein
MSSPASMAMMAKEILVALLLDHLFIGSDGGDVFTFLVIGLDLGEVLDQIFTVNTVLPSNVFLLVFGGKLEVFSLII